jgi:hypothetical protein
MLEARLSSLLLPFFSIINITYATLECMISPTSTTFFSLQGTGSFWIEKHPAMPVWDVH